MPGDLDFDITLDPSQYLAGAQQITQANVGMQSAMANVITQSTIVQRAMDAITPKRATLLGWGALAAGAGQTQQALSGFQATQALTGVSADKLGEKVRQLARDLPIGGTAARQVVAQFTQMGIAGEGSEIKIGKLATSVAKLSGATGSNISDLATGMTDLSRATGNTNLDPVRFAKLGDSLTTISATTGAGATNILAFSKNIAPMASAAGIGATGVLGISSAFARLGEDGVGASTAVNKMLSDLNRSVREGTPEIKTYASFVGKTADEFTALFKSNPAEALTQITEAVAKAGDKGPRMLEQIGLDGVRSQRALQALTASGGLRSAVNDATSSYGNGATDKASQAAFGGLNDATTELQDNFKQLGDALGQPLLGPLTALTKAFSVPISGLRAAAESPVAQTVLTGAAGAAVALGLAKAIAGPLTMLGMGKQAATSSPMRSLFAGYSNEGGDRTGRALAFGAPVEKLVAEEGVYGRGMAAAPAEKAYGLGAGLRQAREKQLLSKLGPAGYYDRMLGQQESQIAAQAPGARAGEAAPRRSMMGRLAGGISSYASLGVEAYGRSLEQTFRDPRVGIGERGMQITPQRGMTAYDTARSARDDGAGIRETVRTFNSSLKESGGQVKGWTGAVGAHAKALGAATSLLGGFSRQGAGMVGGGAMRGLGKLGGGLMDFAGGPVGLGVAAGMGVYQVRQGINERNDAARNAFLDSDISGTLNSYRESIGKATGPVQTVGSLDMSVSKNLAAGVKTFDQAKQVTSADQTAASSSKDKVVNPYVGNNQDVANQIGAINTGGMTPEELQAIKIDLLRQGKTSTDVNQIFQALPASAYAPTQAGNAATGIVDNGALIAGLGKQPGQGGIVGIGNAVSTVGGKNWDAPNALLYASNLGDDTRKQLGGVSESINQQYVAQGKSYGEDYASQTRMQGMDKAYADAVKTGNIDLVNEMSKKFSVTLGGKSAETYISPDQLAAAGGSFTKALATQNKDFGHTLDDFGKRQEQAGGAFSATIKPGYITDLLKGSSPILANLFDQKNTSGAGQAIQNSLASPGDVGKLTTAAESFVTAGTKAGASLATLAGEAANAAGKLDETGQEFAIVAAAQGQIQLQLKRNALTQTPGQSAMEQYNVTSALADQAPSNSAAVNAQTQQAKVDQVSEQAAMVDRIKQRLMMQRQSDIAVGRATQDNNRQVLWANQDFNKQISRMDESYNIQRTRSVEDYHLSVTRAQEDFNTTRTRQVRDYNIGVQRAEEDFSIARGRQVRDFNIGLQRGEQDYLKSRTRAIRDFNISVARMVEDAAKSLYDPYARIQTKATWDAKNLLSNLAEQNDALAKQKTQLDQLRKAGLSAQAIDQLQLGKTENAKQVNNLAQDITKDPSLVAQFNASAVTRSGLSGSMVTDASNTELNRAKEDFTKTLSDQDVDYQTALARSKQDLAKSMADQASDFNKSLVRGRADLNKAMGDQAADFAKSLARGNVDFSKSLGRSAADLALSQKHMETDFAQSMARQALTFSTQIGRMHQDLINADQTLGTDLTKLAGAYNKAIHGQSVSWTGLITTDANAFISDFTTKVIPRIQAAGTQIGITLVGASPNNASSVVSDWHHSAEGGPVPGKSAHKRADNIHIMATAGEYVHPVDAVDYYGNAAMEAIRTRKVPKEKLTGYAEGGLVGYAGGGAVSGGVASRTSSQALEAALATFKNIQGMCLSIVQGWWASGHAFPDAISQWRGTVQHADRQPPPGAPVFFSGGAHGHVALSAGSGLIRSSDVPTMGNVGTVPITWIEKNWAHPYVGWGSTLAGKRLNFDTKPGEAFAGVTASPGAAAGGTQGGGVNSVGLDLAAIIAANTDSTRGNWYGKLRDSFIARAATSSLNGQAVDISGNAGAASANAAANQNIAAALLASYGWGADQQSSLVKLWNGESGWNERANNSSSGAYGIPQALPGSKMASVASDWRTSAKTQIEWGMGYIKNRYDTPNRALSTWNSRSPHWYDEGGFMAPGAGSHVNATGKPEAVLTHEQWSEITKLTSRIGVLLSAEDGRSLRAAAGGSLTINHHEQYTYDQRNDFGNAHITVQADDPDALGRKLEAKATRQRLTARRA